MRHAHEPQRTPLDEAAWADYERINRRAVEVYRREHHCHRCGAIVPVAFGHLARRTCQRCHNTKESK